MRPKIVVIGAGIVGLSVARELSLREFNVIIIEKNTIGSGNTTKCAGMLHSGARYAVKDFDLANVCFEENKILKNIVPFAIGKNKAIFVTLPTDDPQYHEEFENKCSVGGIPIEKLSSKEARILEPRLNKKISGGYLTPDAVIDTFKLKDAYTFDLIENGVNILENVRIVKAHFFSDSWILTIVRKNTKERIKADFVINATGSELAEVAKVLGVNLKLFYIHGTMAVLNNRVSNRIISRCAPSVAGDVIVPLVGGSLIGSTWHELSHNIPINISISDKKNLLQTASLILDNLSALKIVSSFTGIRTHIKIDTNQKRGSFNIKRDYAIIDHGDNKEANNFISILPGKLTTARYVAEKVGNIVAEFFNIHTNSRSKYISLKTPTNYLPSNIVFYVN